MVLADPVISPTTTPMPAVVAHLRVSGAPIIDGPIERTGALAR
jgi:hypothetical protein